MAVGIALAATLVGLEPGSTAFAEGVAPNPSLPSVIIQLPAAGAVLPVDETDKTIHWRASIADAVNNGPADDPLIWLDHVEVLVDGEHAETITADDICTAGCPAPGRPTAVSRNFEWNPAAKGRGLYSISVIATDSAGSATTAIWNYRVVDRATLTLRDSNGAVLPAAIRIPSTAVVTFVADIAGGEPDTIIRSLVLYDGAGRYDDGVEPCAAPAYCPVPVVVRKLWSGSAGKSGTEQDLRIVVEDQWGIQSSVAVHVEAYAATFMVADSELCCSVNLGKAVKLGGVLRSFDDDKGEPGRLVTVQWRPVGWTSWQTVATPTTDSTGRFSGIRHTPHRNGTYRFTYAGVPDILGGAVASVTADVHPRVKGKFRHGGWIHRGHKARLDVHTTPADPTSVWILQRLTRHGHMVTVFKRRIPTSRHTTFAMRLHRRGWHTYQVMRPATAGYGFTYSKTFVVFVQ